MSEDIKKSKSNSLLKCNNWFIRSVVLKDGKVEDLLVSSRDMSAVDAVCFVREPFRREKLRATSNSSEEDIGLYKMYIPPVTNVCFLFIKIIKILNKKFKFHITIFYLLEKIKLKIL